MHQSLQGATFHLKYVIPLSHGGHSQLDNLAWACPSCNLHKANRIDVIDPDAGNRVPLFNPRLDDRDEHFGWDGYRVMGQTPVGRAIVAALEFNYPRRIQIRQAEELLDLFPPNEVGG